MTRPRRVPVGDLVPRWARPLPYPLRRVWQPSIYQGGNRRDDYFEGWYVKCVDAAHTTPIAFIPGVSWDIRGGTSHAFVQVVRPGGETAYLEYPFDQFAFDRRRFEVRVGGNTFSPAGASLDLDCEGIRVKGAITFGTWKPWPVTLRAPGIMGWYRFVPRMECYHGVCSLDHTLGGQIEVDGGRVTFEGGRGYIEKDWGRSFPSSWVWAQSNHFDHPGTSVTVSVAKIPWMRNAFVGSIAGVLLGDELYRFTTYTGAKLTRFASWTGGARMIFDDHQHTLDVEVDGGTPAPLKAPKHGRMIARADESLDASIRAKLTRKRDGAVLLDDCGLHAGVEVMNDKAELEAGVWHPKPREE